MRMCRVLTLSPTDLHRAENDAGVEHQLALGAGRQAYLVCIEGSMQVLAPQGSETTLAARDAAQLEAGAKPLHLTLTAGREGAHFLLVEMKAGS
jgi:redox-sensitive bicupin YhaK (pirin superfamily)